MAGHFYVSEDGRRAVNLAEWVSAEAHAKAASATSGGFMGGEPRLGEGARLRRAAA